MNNKIKIEFVLNGKNVETEVYENSTLVEVIRENFSLTGTKISCNQGECGACTVLVNDVAVNSCLVLATEIDSENVVTIEGLISNNKIDPIQQSFIDEGAVQCGFCTPGMIMSTKGLLLENPTPNDNEIKDALEGNICRCTGYDSIIKAVQSASTKLNGRIDNEE